MNVIFYKEFLFCDDFTPNEKIVYSFLIYKSLPFVEGAYPDISGEMDMDNVQSSIEEDDYISLVTISYRNLSKILNISPRSIISALNKLKLYGIITIGRINAPLEVIQNGYFRLCIESGLKGELLIFYSYLKNKSEYFGGSIDTMKYKLAENLHTTKIAVTNLLNRLYKKGLAERLPNRRLQIN